MAQGIKLRVAKGLDGREIPRNGAVANLYGIDGTTRQQSKRNVLNVLVPVGSGRQYAEVELMPGRYLVEVLLPSGDILSEEAFVKKAEWTKLELTAEQSAHEWHSTHNLLGNVESKEGYDRLIDRTRTGLDTRRPLNVWL